MWRLLLLLCLVVSASAVTVRTWSGGGADANWTTAGNWDVLPVAGNELDFAGGTRLTNTNNFAATTSFARIESLTTGNLTLNGSNSMTLTDYIYNHSAHIVTVNFPIILNVATATISSDVGAAPIVINGAISETGGARNLNINCVTGSTNIVTLAGTNTYTGTTTLAYGWWLLTGSTHASSAVTVNTGTFNNRLLGSGTINGSLTMQDGSTIAPGNNVGTTISTLTVGGAFTMQGASTLIVNTDGNTGTASNVASSGTATLSGVLTIANDNNFSTGHVYTIVSGTSISGTFTGVPNGSTVTSTGGKQYVIKYNATTVTLNSSVISPSVGMMSLFP